MRRLIVGVAILAAPLVHSGADAGNGMGGVLWESDGPLPTAAGPVEVRKSATPLRFDVVVAGRRVGEVEGSAAEIGMVFPDTATAQVVMIQYVSGGSLCPYSYRALEISKPQKVILSAEFGDCCLVEGIAKRGSDWVVVSRCGSAWKVRGGSVKAAHDLYRQYQRSR
jgi:hypothetical protein